MKWEYFLFHYLPSHPYILSFLFFSIHVCPWTPYLANPFPWMLLFYLLLHFFLYVVCVSLLPRSGSPGFSWSPDPSFLSQNCVSPAPHLPPSNLNRTILEVELTKRTATGKKTLLIERETSIWKIFVGRCLLNLSASSDVELSVWLPL